MKFRSVFSKVTSKLRGLVRKPKMPQAPKSTQREKSDFEKWVAKHPQGFREVKGKPFFGHGGVHMTDVAMRERRMLEAGTTEAAYTPEERQRWRQLTADEAYRFLYEAQPIRVNSSNVDEALYNCHSNQLFIRFKNGSAYRYENISESEAQQFLTYASKGSYVWDKIRVRGKGNARKTRKPYRRII